MALEKLVPVITENFAREAGENLWRDRFAGGVQRAANAQRGGKCGFEVQIARALLFGGGYE